MRLKTWWQHMGREKFKEVHEQLEFVQESEHHAALWLYGAQDFGKSRLLAALVCY
jgi:hypothetical protein